MNWVAVFSLAGVILLTFTAFIGYLIKNTDTLCFKILEWVLCLVTAVLSLVAIHIAYLSPARSHTLKTLFDHYKIYMVTCWRYRTTCRRFRKIMQNAANEQELVLKRILQKQYQTRYGRENNIFPDLSISRFRQLHPLTRYSHYQTYIDQMVAGEENVLFPEKTDFLITTSGTTSFKCKLFPRNKSSLLKYLMYASLPLSEEILTWRGMNSLKRPIDVRVFHPPREVSPGVYRGPISSISHKPLTFGVSHPATYDLHNEEVGHYVHAFFALSDPDINYMKFLTTTAALSFFRLIEERWEEFCDDIEHGCLSDKLDISDEIRLELESHIVPNPQRAACIRSELKQGCRNILQKLWPSCQLISASANGAFYPATKQLKQHYTGDAFIRSSVHVSTEGICGIGLHNNNRKFEDHNFSILPHVNFYEFISEDECHLEDPQTVLATEVEVGRVYEIVLTSELGLYRYRTEDMVRITSFNGSTPSYRFEQRSGEFISLNMFKCPGAVLEEVMESAERQWGKPVHQYAAVENIHADIILGKVSKMPFFYVFVELMEDDILTDIDKAKVHQILLDTFKAYEWSYNNGQITLPTVLQTTKGTFDEIKEITLRLNPDTASLQYKLNRFTRRQEILECVFRRLGS